MDGPWGSSSGNNDLYKETALTTAIKEDSDISYKTMFLEMMKQKIAENQSLSNNTLK